MRYSIRRLFLANRIMDEGPNVEMAVRNVVRDQLARDVNYGIQDLRDIRAVLSDESWGNFWNWLVYVRDVNDGLGRGAESINRLPYPYRRVANPLNVVCSPAMGFSRSDLLNVILGTSQQPRNLEDLEEVLSLRCCCSEICDGCIDERQTEGARIIATGRPYGAAAAAATLPLAAMAPQPRRPQPQPQPSPVSLAATAPQP